jgi:hypothetical protein
MPLRDAQRRKVYVRDNYTCVDCGLTGRPGRTHGTIQAHHVTPRCGGGSDALENLVTLCYKCHRARHAADYAVQFANHDRPAGWGRDRRPPDGATFEQLVRWSRPRCCRRCRARFRTIESRPPRCLCGAMLCGECWERDGRCREHAGA